MNIKNEFASNPDFKTTYFAQDQLFKEEMLKQEVAKLIEPAIKDITTKMDEKLKQVQDVVSGGVNPTA